MDFYVKNRKNMRFSWEFLQNMLENGHSNWQIKFGVHITSNIFKILQFKNHGIASTPWPQNFESLPYPRWKLLVWKFFAKMNGKVELEGTRSNFNLWLRDFENQGENCLEVVATPLRRTRVNITETHTERLSLQMMKNAEYSNSNLPN